MANSNPELPGIGVFGTGTMVKCLVPILKSCGFKVEALWGRTEEEASNCARDLAIYFYTTKVDEMLLHKGVDLIFINLPPLTQSPIAVKALGIGKHVICGTPTGPTQLQVLRMLKAAEYYPSIMSIMCNGLRLLPSFKKMKELIANQSVGQIKVVEVRVECSSLLRGSFDWLCDDTMGGGVLNIYGSLFIDLIHFILQQSTTHVQGNIRTFSPQTEDIKGFRRINSDDFASFTLHFDHSLLANVTINSHSNQPYQHEVVAWGTRGRLIVRGCDLYRVQSGREEVVHREVQCILDTQQSGVLQNICADIPAPHMKGLFRLIDAVKDAFKSVGEKQNFMKTYGLLDACTFKQQHYVQAVLEAISKSSRHHAHTKVEVLREEPQPHDIYVIEALRRQEAKYY